MGQLHAYGPSTAALDPATGEFTLVLVGDTSLGDSYLRKRNWEAERLRLELDPGSFFEALSPLISDKSCLVANLETVLVDVPDGGIDGKRYRGWDNPHRTIETLRAVGVDAVSLANNHSMDFGVEGLLGGIDLLRQSGIRVFGAGADLLEAGQPLSLAAGGRNIHILGGFEYRPVYDTTHGFYAKDIRPGVSSFDLARDNALARSASRLRSADPGSIIVAYPHWGGAKNYTWATEAMRNTADGILAAGADLVVGHGAHMLQHCAATVLGTSAFSLGNFVFNAPGRYGSLGAPPYSLICRLQFTETRDGRLEGDMRLYPIVSDNRQTGFRPRPVDESEARAVYDLLARGGDVGFSGAFGLDRDERGWFIALLSPMSPRFDGAASTPPPTAAPTLVPVSWSSGMTMTQETAVSHSSELVRDCVKHLLSLIGTDGKFVYAHRFLDPSDIQPGYNLLRHCGTVWFMSKAIRSLGLDFTADDASRLEAAVRYIGSKLARPAWIEGLLPAVCLTSKDAVKLGGVGLSNLMVREYNDLLRSRNSTPAAGVLPEDPEIVCAQLENYILAQSTGDDFLHKRVFSTGRVLPFHSDYYTGEALFALAQGGRPHAGARSTMESLLLRGYGLDVQSHWMSYAASAAIRSGFCDAATATAYLIRMVERIIADNAYRARHESTPIACRSEALAEILLLLRDRPDLAAAFSSDLIERARATLQQNLNLQLAYYGSGQFRKGRVSDKVQIDYIQHNGASFLAALQLSDHQA
jgi:poly-gamma-glutamate capsule biosynthesis protein CapA/YwtB (metallophosphatase superfamily)